jgi:hypothetical protein
MKIQCESKYDFECLQDIYQTHWKKYEKSKSNAKICVKKKLKSRL